MIDILFLLAWWGLLWGLPALASSYKSWGYGIILLFLVATGSVTMRCYYRAAYPLKIIREDTMARVGPDETYGSCGVFKAHDKVVLCKTNNTWQQVQKIDDSMRGWVPQESVSIDIS